MHFGTRFYITSKEKYLSISRNHWGLENKLHWGLDVIMGEDKSRKRNNNIAENFSMILKLILKISQEKLSLNKKISIKRMIKRLDGIYNTLKNYSILNELDLLF